MRRKYQHTQELLPKIKELLNSGMTQEQAAERMDVPVDFVRMWCL